MKKISRTIGSTITILLLIPFIASADTTYTTANNHSTGIAGFGDTARHQSAQSFLTTEDGYLDTVTAYVKNESSASDNTSWSIQADNSGVPSGTPLESGTIDVTGSSCTVYTWTAGQTTALSNATTYWIVFDRTGSYAGYDYTLCGDEPSTYADGTEADSDSGTWSTKNRDAYLQIHSVTTGGGGGGGETSTTTGTTTPELISAFSQLTIALLLSFAIGFVMSVWIFKSYILS